MLEDNKHYSRAVNNSGLIREVSNLGPETGYVEMILVVFPQSLQADAR
jgi:hypothetical protein